MKRFDRYVLLNLANGIAIKEIAEEDLRKLEDCLEEESQTDTSYFVDQPTVDLIRRDVGVEIGDAIGSSMGTMEETTIGYAPLRPASAGSVKGRLLDLGVEAPLPGYKVEIYDQDVIADDLLGWCYTDQDGRFQVCFDESDFKDSQLEGLPEIKIRVFDQEESEVGTLGFVQNLQVDLRDVYISGPGKLTAPHLDSDASSVCPQCGATYRSGFDNCSACGVPLRRLRSSA